MLKGGRPSDKWSISNRFIMYLSGTTDARGYRQWQEVGRYVKQGAKAFHILGPIFIKKVERDILSGKDVEKQILIGFRTIPVFRYEDTEGQPLPEYKNLPLPPLAEVAQKWGVSVKYGFLPNAYGAYNPESKSITLNSQDAPTFFHELAHAGQHRIDGSLHHGQDPEQEAIAELTAAVLARLYGQPSDNFSWNYIAHYSGKDITSVARMCMKVASKVERI
jgi:antirestriction protein ArdC